MLRSFSSKLESFVLGKIERWALLLTIIIGFVLTVTFAWLAKYHGQGIGQRDFGIAGDVATSVAGWPERLIRVFDFIDNEVIEKGAQSEQAAVAQRFNGASGFTFDYLPGTRPDLGYVLINRVDGDLGFAISELWDLNSQRRVHEWRFDGVDDLWQSAEFESIFTDLAVDKSTHRFRNVHAFLGPEGDLLTHSMDSPMVSADLCSRLSIFQQDVPFHHSIEQDHEGSFWIPAVQSPKSIQLGDDYFRDDAIAKVSSQGDLLFLKSISEILIENDLGYLVLGTGLHNRSNNDPIHLNDIEPALEGGPFWRQGDVFLSLRNLSMVLLYRPSTNEVVWHRQGPWLHQHDVDIVGTGQISVFDNNVRLDAGSTFALALGGGTSGNRVLLYDFAQDSVSYPWRQPLRDADIKTGLGGLSHLAGSNLMVEETGYGRLIQFADNGKRLWQFVNRSADGVIYSLVWSRYVSRALGDLVKEKTESLKC